MKIVVLGYTGMLGRYVSKYFETSDNLIKLSRKDIDASNIKKGELKAKLYHLGIGENDVIINCIGMIKQRDNASDLDFILVNSVFPLMLADVCEEENIKLIHPTTDCFLPNTKVLTNNGYKNIENIDTTDYIYTHNNSLKKVIDIMSKPVNEEILKIKTLGNDEIKCTKNHPWYSIKRESKELFDFNKKEWVKSGELKKGNLILIPKLNLENQSIFNINLLSYSKNYENVYNEYNFFLNNIKNRKMNIKKYCNDNNLNYRKIIKWKNNDNIKPKVCKLINNLEINNELMWFFGIFLAEGWVDNKIGRKTITLTFGDEKDLIDKTITIINKYFNIEPNIKYFDNQKGCQIYFTHQLLSEMLSNDFYINDKHYSHTKKIPNWVSKTNKNNVSFFIKGYIDGDGCFYDDINAVYISSSSVSEQLTDDLKILYMKLGFLPSKSLSNNSGECIICDRLIKTKNKYNLTISGEQLLNLFNILDIKSNFFDTKNRYNKFFQDEKYWYVPITKIDKEYYKGMVYNMEVEDDNSYLVNGGLSVHNCVYDGLEGKYDENSEHNAKDVYGKTKSLGEPKNATTIRTSIIGDEINNKKSLVEWVKSNKDKTVFGYTNHHWNGVTCLQFAKICRHIIDNNLYWKGVRHVVSPTTVTKEGLVNMISDVYDLNITVTPKETHILCDRSLNSIYLPNVIIPELIIQVNDMKDFYSTLVG